MLKLCWSILWSKCLNYTKVQLDKSKTISISSIFSSFTASFWRRHDSISMDYLKCSYYLTNPFLPMLIFDLFVLYLMIFFLFFKRLLTCRVRYISENFLRYVLLYVSVSKRKYHIILGSSYPIISPKYVNNLKFSVKNIPWKSRVLKAFFSASSVKSWAISRRSSKRKNIPDSRQAKQSFPTFEDILWDSCDNLSKPDLSSVYRLPRDTTGIFTSLGCFVAILFILFVAKRKIPVPMCFATAKFW